MPKLCMASVKKDKYIGNYTLKAQIKEAEDKANMIEGFFNEVFKQMPSAKQSIKTANLTTVWFCVAITLAPKGFYVVGTGDTFDTGCDECLTPKNPQSICIIESCLSSLGINDDYIPEIMERFYNIRRMYKKNEGNLPLYNLDIAKEVHLLAQHKYWNIDSNGGQKVVNFIKNQL